MVYRDSLPYTPAELDTLATHCTARKDAATKIERLVQESASAILLPMNPESYGYWDRCLVVSRRNIPLLLGEKAGMRADAASPSRAIYFPSPAFGLWAQCAKMFQSVLSSQTGHQYDGLVTGASEKGTWVRIFQPPVEGNLVGGYAGL